MTDDPHAVSLREYMETRFRDRDTQLELARQNLEKRLDGLNALRNEVNVDRGRFLEKTVYEAKYEILSNRVSILENFRSKATGVAVVLVLFAAVVGAAIAKALGG